MATTTPNYAVDYDDKRLTDIKAEEQTVIQDSKDMYGEMVGDIETQYKGVADQVQKNAETMIQTQNENTDFQVKLIEQQKEQAQKDYIKEQSASYVDYQKQINPYGINAEQMASQGLLHSGYSESSKVAMYNQYQNRVAVARETLSKVIMNYDNNIAQARLENNSTIAQIQSEASLKQAEILLEGFAYKQTLLQKQADRELQIKSMYQDKWQSELSQINTENALAEQVRQAQIKQENDEKNYQLALKEAESQAKYREEQIKLAQAQQKLAEDEYNAKYGSKGIETLKAQKEIEYYDDLKLKDANKVTNSSYWNGERAQNVGNFGYFSNGYQPKGVMDGGKAYELKSAKTTDGNKATIWKTNTTLWGTEETKEITVWQANGKYYYWNGPTNQYVAISKSELKKMGVNVK